MIAVKRAYEPAAKSDGKRFLVDRLWPRGLKKENLHLDGWVRDAAPSSRPANLVWARPAKNGPSSSGATSPSCRTPMPGTSCSMPRRHEKITLLYGARDEQHNNAVALKEFLEARLKRHRRPPQSPCRLTLL